MRIGRVAILGVVLGVAAVVGIVLLFVLGR